MKRTTLAICFTVVCSLALVLYAQAPPPAQTPPAQTPPATEKAMGKSLTLTGCLQAGSEPDSFVLTNVSAAGSESAQRTTPGELAKTDTSYKLTAEGNVKLKEHVGHKVEITGTPGAKAPYSATPPSPTDRPKAEMANLKVTAIKHISPTCP